MRGGKEISEAIGRVLEAESEDFVYLVKIAGLDPSSAFQFADLSNLDFSGLDLSGFNFTSARLDNCSFGGAKISDAIFPKYLETEAILRSAADWGEYADKHLQRTSRNELGINQKNLEKPTLTDRVWDILLEVDFHVLEQDGYELQVRGEDVIILAHVHCVPSIVELLHFLLTQDFAIPARQIIIISNPYSTISSAAEVVKKLGVTLVQISPQFEPGHYGEVVSFHLKAGCKKATQLCFDMIKRGRRPRLILIDDGGMVTDTWWRHFKGPDCDVVSVQLTASGLGRAPDPSKLTKIDVARSAAKQKFEAKILSNGVLRRVRDLDKLKDITRVGVVGVGSLGGTLAQSLVDMHKEVNIFDTKEYSYKPQGSHVMASLGELVRQSDFIFGCTGKNFLGSGVLSRLGQKRHFASCSSGDIEFLELLRLGHINKSGSFDPFGRLQVNYKGQTHFIENGGFPINFDRKTEHESPWEIVLTRALLLAGILQAMCVKTSQPQQDAIMLSPSLQKALVLKWLELTAQDVHRYLGPGDHRTELLDWWKCHSGGESSIAHRGQPRPALSQLETARRLTALTMAGRDH